MHSNKQNAIDVIEAGDIGAAVGFKDIKTGDSLTAEKSPIVLESMDFPDPVIGIAVEAKTKADVDKLGMALAKLSEEDPTFTVRTDEASGQTIISGMGELHLDIIVDRLKREFKVEVNEGEPMVEYKEAITLKADHREVYKKQSGGRGKFADIAFTVEPPEEGVREAASKGSGMANPCQLADTCKIFCGYRQFDGSKRAPSCGVCPVSSCRYPQNILRVSAV